MLHITDVCFHKIAVISSTVNHQVNEVDKFTLVYWPMLSEKKRKKGSTGFWCGGFLGWSWNYTVGPFSGFLWHALATFISQYFLLTSTVVGSYIYRYTYIAHASSCHSHWSVNCYYLQLSMTVWVWGIVQVVKSKSLNKKIIKNTTFWSGPSSPWRFFDFFKFIFLNNKRALLRAGHHHHGEEEASVKVAEKAVEGAAVAGSDVGTGTDHDHVHEHSHEHHDMTEEHSIIGITLVVGFIFMLLVDQMGGNFHSHSGPGMLSFQYHIIFRTTSRVKL